MHKSSIFLLPYMKIEIKYITAGACAFTAAIDKTTTLNLNRFIDVETKPFQTNHNTRYLNSMANLTVLCKSNLQVAAGWQQALLKTRDMQGSQFQEKKMKTGECKCRRPRFHAGNCSLVVQCRRLHGPTNASRSGANKHMGLVHSLHAPCTGVLF